MSRIRTSSVNSQAVNNQPLDSDPDESQMSLGLSYCLKNIVVSQNYRNRGIGTALLEAVINYCKVQRVTSIHGEARGEMKALRKWYQNNGFKMDCVDNIEIPL